MGTVKGLTRTEEQVGLLMGLVIATLGGIATGILAILPFTQAWSLVTGIPSFLLFTIVIAWARDIQAIPILHRKERARGPTRQALDWQLLRGSSLLLNLLILVGLIVILLELLSAGGATDATRQEVLEAIAAALTSSISVVLGFTLFQSLRTDYGIPKATYRTIFSILLLSGAAILAIGAIGFRTGPNASFLFLASGIFAAAGAFAWRDLPNVYSLATEDKSAYRSGTRLTRTQSTVLPTVIAFGLLFVVLLMFLLFGASTVGRLGEVLLQPSFMILAIIIVMAIIGSVAAVIMLGRSKPEDDIPLFEEFVDEAVNTRRMVLWVSLAVASIVAIFSLLVGVDIALFNLEQGRWVDLIAVATMIGIGPYGFYRAHEFSRIRRLEERFPDFLRDIASSHRGGLTLPAAVRIASRGEYGPLTPEVQRMADQMSWNVPFDEALHNFAQRVATPLVQRTVSLIQEAGRSGGNTAEVLLAAAKDARQLKNMENDRRLSMTLYGVIIYITFFVFLLVAAVLHNQFVPQIILSSEAIAASAIEGGTFGISVVGIDDYRAFYFVASIVQGLGGGMVAGMMSTGKAVLGLRHAFIMTLIAFVTFVLFLI